MTCVQYTMETTSLIIYVYFVGVAAYKVLSLAFIRQFYGIDSNEKNIQNNFDESGAKSSFVNRLIHKTLYARVVVFDIIPCVLSFAGIFVTKNPLFIVYSLIPFLVILLFELAINVYRKNEFRYDFIYFLSTTVVSLLLAIEFIF